MDGDLAAGLMGGNLVTPLGDISDSEPVKDKAAAAADTATVQQPVRPQLAVEIPGSAKQLPGSGRSPFFLQLAADGRPTGEQLRTRLGKRALVWQQQGAGGSCSLLGSWQQQSSERQQ